MSEVRKKDVLLDRLVELDPSDYTMEQRSSIHILIDSLNVL